mmetsp:Transcript_1693/g.3785  ORF Transcript_1693/g.3785 Transcript_1693/m.3785 type:complete len:810 (-) Transcript_1693:204-2633(-)
MPSFAVSLLLLLLLQITRFLPAADAAAFLGGVKVGNNPNNNPGNNPNNNNNNNNSNIDTPKGSGTIPIPTRPKETANTHTKPMTTTATATATKNYNSKHYDYGNKQYAFITTPRDKYFTSTGILPPLIPSYNDNRDDDDDNNSNDIGGNNDVVHVTYTNDPNSVDEWLCRNLAYGGCFLGFDIERLPAPRSKNPDPDDRTNFAHASLVQLATPHACLVVHLVDANVNVNVDSTIGVGGVGTTATTTTNAPPTETHPRHSNACAEILKSVLEDPAFVKAGCSIDEDLVLLHELWRTKSKKRANANSNGSSSSGTSTSNNNSGNNKNRNPTILGRGNAVGKKRRSKGQGNRVGANHGRNNANNNNADENGSASLRAKSRFDLGCVVLPKKKHFPNNNNVAVEEQPIRKADDNDDQHQQHPPHNHRETFRIAAANMTTHAATQKQSSGGSNGGGSSRPRLKPLIHNKSGLQGLCKAILNIDLPKERDDCQSDWTRFPLSDDQITYAARDAWAGVAIATKLANDHSVFRRSNLIQVLGETETPLPQLAKRHRQRKEAKMELEALLHSYAEVLPLRQEQDADQGDGKVDGDGGGDNDGRENEEHHRHSYCSHCNRNSNGNNGNGNNGQKKQWQVKSPIHKKYVDVAELFASRARMPSWTTTTKTMLKAAARNETFPLRSFFAATKNSPKATKNKKKKNRISSSPKKQQHRLHLQEQHQDRERYQRQQRQQQQRLENNLPKRIRKKTTALRQIVNARVIDHMVVFEIDVVGPSSEQDREQQQQQNKGDSNGNVNVNSNRDPQHNGNRQEPSSPPR